MIKKYLTGDGNVAHSITIQEGMYMVKDIQVHTSAAIAATLTISIDSVNGSVYDTVMSTTDMTGKTDLLLSNLEWTVAVGDKLTFALTNAGSKTWGICVGICN